MDHDEIVAVLTSMEENPTLITEPGFRANSEVWPDHIIPFVDNHLDYLKTHRGVTAQHYLSNLRLQLRRR